MRQKRKKYIQATFYAVAVDIIRPTLKDAIFKWKARLESKVAWVAVFTTTKCNSKSATEHKCC